MSYQRLNDTITAEMTGLQRSTFLALRFVRLHCFIQVTPWRQTAEMKKTVIYSGRKTALLNFLAHAIPLTVVLLLICFNLRGYVADRISKTFPFTSLQFAAKALEILMQSSIALMVLDLVRRQAISTHGLPYGGFLAPQQITHLGYLWSLELWGFATSSSLHVWYRVIWILVIILATILAALVGPSSAVALIPRFIEISSDENFVVLQADPLETYPMRLTLDNEELPHEYDLTSSFYALQQSANFTLAQNKSVIAIPGGDIPTRILHVEVNYPRDGSMSVFNSSIPTKMSSFLSSEIQLSDGKYRGMSVHTNAREAFVGQNCYMTEFTNLDSVPSDYNVYFGQDESALNDFFALSDIYPNMSIPNFAAGVATFNLYYSYLTYIEKRVTFIWQESPSDLSDYSLLQVIVSEELKSGWITIWACGIEAYWRKSSFIYDRGRKTIDREYASMTRRNMTESPTITIDPKWMRAAMTIFWETRNPTIYQRFRPPHTGTIISLGLSSAGPEDREWTLQFDRINVRNKDAETALTYQQSESMISLMDIESSRAQSRYKYMTIWSLQGTNFTNWTDASTLPSFSFQLRARVYGYNSEGTTVRLSLAVLFFYVFLVILYLAFTIATAHTSTSWDSIGEVVTLALHSKQPSHLSNTSAGILTVGPYQRSVYVRANKESQAMELIFADDPKVDASNYEGVKYDKKYA